MFNGFGTPIARFATRPGSGEIKDFDKPEIQDVTPDLIMGTLMRGGAHLLKSNTIYELVMNEMTGIMEVHEVGKSTINKQWARAYHEIPYNGHHIWLSEDEQDEYRKQNQREEV